MKTNTDYAINKKNPDAIVYTFADGTTSILTKADFASEEEFRKWKVISDKSLHEIEKDDNYYGKVTCSLDATEFDGNEPGKEDDYFVEERIIEEEKLCEKVQLALSKCSEIQQKRLWAFASGMSTYAIAEEENVYQSAVFKSIEGGKKIFKKNF